MFKSRSILICYFLIWLSVGCASQPQQQEAVSASTSDQRTCGTGWAVRLVNVEEEDAADGWKYVTAWIAFENVHAPKVSANDIQTWGSPPSGFLLLTTDGSNVLTAVSAEGYRYEARATFAELLGSFGRDWVPPGFRYRGVTNQTGSLSGYPRIFFQAAQASSNYTINTNCGVLDLSQREELSFPVEDGSALSFLSVGEPVQLPEGEFMVTGIHSCSTGNANAVCVDMQLINNSAGYEADPKLGLFVLDDSGLLYKGFGGWLVAGPGQTKTDTVEIFYGENRILVISRIDSPDYWLVNLDQ